jgi:hypothetical protein
MRILPALNRQTSVEERQPSVRVLLDCWLAVPGYWQYWPQAVGCDYD